MKRFGLGLITLSIFAIGGPLYPASYYLTDEFEVSKSMLSGLWLNIHGHIWMFTNEVQLYLYLVSCHLFLFWGFFQCGADATESSQSEWEHFSVRSSLGSYLYRIWKWKMVAASQITAFWLLQRSKLKWVHTNSEKYGKWFIVRGVHV